MRGLFGFLSLLITVGVIIWLSMHGLKGFMGSGDPQTLDAAKSRAESSVCRTNRKILGTAINQFRSANPGKPVTLQTLEAAGVTFPECPSGGTYSIENGRVVCSIHRE